MKLFGGEFIPSKNIFGISYVILPNHRRDFYLKNFYKAIMKNPKNKGVKYEDFIAHKSIKNMTTQTLRLFWVNEIGLKHGKEWLIYK